MIKLFKIFIFSFFNLFLINASFSQIELFHQVMPQKVVDESGEEQFVSPDVEISVFNSSGLKFVENETIPALLFGHEKHVGYVFPDDGDSFMVNVSSSAWSKKFYFNCLLDPKKFNCGVFLLSFDVDTKKHFLSLRELVNNHIGNEIVRADEIKNL